MGLNVFDLLLPRETKFFELMYQQVALLLKGAVIFKQLVDNFATTSESDLKVAIARIKQCETRGDDVEREIVYALHKTFITPIDREDIHVLALNNDRALDILNSISRKIKIYGIKEVPQNVCGFADIIVRITEELQVAIRQLSKKAGREEAVAKMRKLENEADELFHRSMAELFENHKDDPVYIIKFKEFYEHLENLVDAIDYVGKLVRGIMVKTG